MNGKLDSFRDRLLGIICQYDFMLYIMLIFEIMLLLLGLFSYLFADLNQETQTILMLDFALLGIIFGGTVLLIYLCGKYS